MQALPRDLHALYIEMWRRLNDNEPIYREDGARFLNLVLAYKDMTALGHPLDGLTVALLGLASDEQLRSKILQDPNYEFSPNAWVSHYYLMRTPIMTRCAGLFDVTRIRCGLQEVESADLIHRSAKAFLQNDDCGSRIMRYDQSTYQARV